MIAIDLGSNSLRFIEYDCQSKKFVREYEAIVKTAELLHSDGIISDGAVKRILKAFDEAFKRFDFNAHECVAVTTEAMRRASNSQEVLDLIEKKTLVKFEVIGANKEAQLTLLAVDKRLESLGFRGPFLLIDIGGGSTEIIFKKGNLSESKSFPIGIVTMASKYAIKEKLRANLAQELVDIKKYVNSYFMKEGKPNFFVATAGTPTTIASFLQGMTYDSYDKNRINGSTLNRFDCQKALDELLALNFDERAKYVGVGREDLIFSGVLIFEAFFELFGYENSVIIDDGLREGLALHSCN